MLWKSFCLLFVAAISFAQIQNKGKTLPASSYQNVYPVKTSINQDHGFLQGFDLQVWMSNRGALGLNYLGQGITPNGFGMEYPAGSGIEHLAGAGLWVGAIIDTSTTGIPKRIKAVSTAYEGWAGPLFEMFGNPNGRDSFYVTSIDQPNGHNRKGFDDDGDGKIDEDELDGIDNDHDGLIDEDYGAVSEHDVYVSYSDMYGNPDVLPNHIPLGIRVWQRSFAWGKRVKEPILPFEFFITNVGNKVLDSVYLGFFVDPDVGPASVQGYFSHNVVWGDFGRTIYAANPIDRPSNPIAFTLLGSSRPLDSLNVVTYSFMGAYTPSSDAQRYDVMVRPPIITDPPLYADMRGIIGLGPFHSFRPGDTLTLTIAFEGSQTDLASLRNNIAIAQTLFERKFMTPPAPPSPPLHVTREFNKVTLDWRWKSGDYGIDPLQAWDDWDSFLNALPDTSWRKRNPPAGHSRGGRFFEGFRLYRCEHNAFDSSKFFLVGQYDIIDELHVSNQTGLQYTYVDSGLTPGKTYWYAVTSFSIPNHYYKFESDSADIFGNLSYPESNISDNAISVSLAREYRLSQAYPNPFNPKTTIKYDIPVTSNVRLSVYDVLGREVARLVDAVQTVGRHAATWDAGDVATGVYFYQIRTGDFVDTKKIVVLR